MTRDDDETRFQRLQAAYFERADEEKFRWQTSNAYLAVTEHRLLRHAVVRPGERLLEVGCGEGGNLRLLSVDRPGTIGVDLSRAKVGWAKKKLAGAAFLCSDAVRLPFRDGTFDVVLCRDVLHHVRAKRDVVAELFRVCGSHGRVIVIEPNGRNPIMWLLGRAVAAERDLIENSPDRVVALVRQRAQGQADTVFAQPFPFGRMLFHYRLGFPRLSSWLSGAVLAVEGLMERLIPPDRWAYIVVTVTKGGPAASASG
jgi:SAM-dependent methyltransferase